MFFFSLSSIFKSLDMPSFSRNFGPLFISSWARKKVYRPHTSLSDVQRTFQGPGSRAAAIHIFRININIASLHNFLRYPHIPREQCIIEESDLKHIFDLHRYFAEVVASLPHSGRFWRPRSMVYSSFSPPVLRVYVDVVLIHQNLYHSFSPFWSSQEQCAGQAHQCQFAFGTFLLYRLHRSWRRFAISSHSSSRKLHRTLQYRNSPCREH